MKYIRRIVDDVIDRRTEAFNAISITGPKGCGKTRTAKERSKTIIEFQDEDKRDGYLAVAETAPKLFLKNPKPILFDEWQDAVKIWGTIRKACDDNPENVGEFYLTGSASKKINTPHTGTGRITEVTMYPMTLFETRESNGKISLSKILEDENYDIIPSGNYLVIYHKGTYETSYQSYHLFLDYAKKNHLVLDDIAYDESLIDELTEANPQNYITQISVKFKKELE